MDDLLNVRSGQDFNALSTICKFMLAQAKKCPGHDNSWTRFFLATISFAEEAEELYGHSDHEILDNLYRTGLHAWPDTLPWIGLDLNSFLYIAVRFGFQSYIMKYAKRIPEP
jgi:hypothetical protein